MPTPIQVKLSPAEVRMAAEMGITRQLMNLFKGRPDAYGASKNAGWQLHIEGCCGEMAVAKHLNLYWSGNFEDLKADDVGTFQVRTADTHNKRLILHEKDPDDRIFIFVTGVAPEYWLQGWIYARDGKNKRYWSDPAGGRPAFFIDKRALCPMTALPRTSTK